MTTAKPSDEVVRLPDEEERQLAAIDRLVRARGIERYGIFFDVGEGTFLPDGTEDVSGHLVDQSGRHFFFWTGWDSDRGEVMFETWKETPPPDRWRDSDEYRQARKEAGLTT